MKSGSELYFAQSDNRTSGEIIYRMQVKQAGPSRLVIAIENVTAVRKFLIPFFEPGDLQSVHYLERNGPGLWSYYGFAWAGEHRPSLLQMPDASYVNRALAVQPLRGSPDREMKPMSDA